MTGNAKVKFNLNNGAKKVFAFQVKGRGVNHIENKVSDFLQQQRLKYGDQISMLVWEVQFLD
tara:strand:- start:475 stop:660 length:186 start_codon:yes stop_codon:yes gene_type:complete